MWSNLFLVKSSRPLEGGGGGGKNENDTFSPSGCVEMYLNLQNISFA